MARRAFFSFHYKPDNWRAAKVRNIGVVEGNRPATDNVWETVIGGGDTKIKRWIADQMKGRTCTVVLIGANTAGRKWITHEIVKSWDQGMGVVGVHVHGLKNLLGKTSTKGANPFSYVTHGPTNKRLSSIVRCYSPVGTSSRAVYRWIDNNLEDMVEEEIEIRNDNE